MFKSRRFKKWLGTLVAMAAVLTAAAESGLLGPTASQAVDEVLGGLPPDVVLHQLPAS